MIGYVFIILALLAFSAQFAFNKVYEQSMGQKMFSTFILVFISNLVGVVLMFAINGFKLNFSLSNLGFAGLLAIATIIVDVVSILVLSLGNLAMYGAFMMIGGMVLPFINGMCFLGDAITVCKIVGIVLLTAFLLLQVKGQMGNEEIKRSKKDSVKYYLLCVLVFIANGFMGVICTYQDGYAKSIAGNDQSLVTFTANSFMFYMCAICVVVSLIVLFVLYLKNKNDCKVVLKNYLTVKPVLSSVLMGVVMNMGGILLLWALNNGVESSTQYPIVSGGTIVLSALCSMLIFKEKIKKLELIAVILIFASTFLFLF